MACSGAVGSAGCAGVSADTAGRSAGHSAIGASSGGAGAFASADSSLRIEPCLPGVPCALDLAPLPCDVMRGMGVAHNWQDGGARGYGSPVSASTLQDLRELGVNWVSLSPFGFMGSRTSTSIRLAAHVPGGESDERIRQEVAAAHARGIRVLLKPQIWIARGDWCGQIEPDGPDGWSAWFEAYREFILHYAGLARDSSCDMLAVGNELGSSSVSQADRWRALIGEVRKVYKGRLVYAANWDEAERVPWWEAVDFVGVNFYAPLTGEGAKGGNAAAVLAGWMARYQALSARAQRPVVFTEVGYKSMPGTTAQPHLWPEQVEGGVAPSEEAQAAAYRVFLEGVRGQRWVAGLFWWKWFTDPASGEEGPEGFSPRGKLSERVLRAAYGGRCGG